MALMTRINEISDDWWNRDDNDDNDSIDSAVGLYKATTHLSLLVRSLIMLIIHLHRLTVYPHYKFFPSSHYGLRQHDTSIRAALRASPGLIDYLTDANQYNKKAVLSQWWSRDATYIWVPLVSSQSRTIVKLNKVFPTSPRVSLKFPHVSTRKLIGMKVSHK